MDFTTERKPRFERKPSLIPQGFRITGRDEEVLLAVARHRIARSTHITALIRAMHSGASEQHLLRRFEGLYPGFTHQRPEVKHGTAARLGVMPRRRLWGARRS